jgi:splicing factor U2AF 65 kDa subunit
MRRRRFKSQWDVKPATLVNPAGIGGAATVVAAAPLASQATRHARRLYVGGLQPPIVQDELEEYFTRVIRERIRFVHNPLPEGSRPVMSIYINQERRFAFVEFATIELACAVIKMDGIEYQGMPLRIKRPNDYQPHMLPPGTRERAEDVNLSGISNANLFEGVSESRQRVFIGNLPPTVDEGGLKAVFSAFGAIKSLYLVRDSAGISKGFGFVEYEDEAIADAVCSQLNGMDIASRPIVVSKSKTAVSGASLLSNPLTSMAGPSLSAAAAMPAPTPLHSPPVLGPVPGASTEPGTVVCIDDAVAPSDTSSAAQFGDLVADLAMEASRFGRVTHVIVPRAPQAGVGSAFVQFATAEAAASAVRTLNGLIFNSRSVTVRLFDAGSFAHGKFA